MIQFAPAELIDDLSAGLRRGRLAEALDGYVHLCVSVVDEGDT